MESIIPIDHNNYPQAAALAVQLWPECSQEEMLAQYKSVASSQEAAGFLLLVDTQPAGLIELSIRRDHVEGADAGPVAYVEGLYVVEKFRHRGYAGRLIQQAEAWARGRGFRQLCSDTELGNQTSILFHKAAGFSEVSRIVCFAKNLD